jgi:hypothetical protein
VKVGAKAKVSDLNFAVVHGKGAKPVFDHFAEDNEIYPSVLKATD